MWPNIKTINIGEYNKKQMKLEDLSIFQCIHMARHIVYRRFGIRHLVDFALLINKKGKEIDWLNLLDRCKKYGIYKFILQVMLACNFLFDMTIPSDIEFVKNESLFKRYIKFLFPKVESMSDIYNYAKKYKVLKPLAWGHHLVRGVCNEDYSFKEKIRFTTETVGVSKKRNDLINWLEL